MAVEGIRNLVSLSDKLATAGQPSEEQVRELARAGFDMVVNLGVLDPRYCLPDEAGLAESLGMTYHHIPVDFKAPLFENLKKFFHVMDASHDKRVFVTVRQTFASRPSLPSTGRSGLVGQSMRPTLTSRGSGTRMTRGRNSLRYHGGIWQIAADTPCNSQGNDSNICYADFFDAHLLGGSAQLDVNFRR